MSASRSTAPVLKLQRPRQLQTEVHSTVKIAAYYFLRVAMKEKTQRIQIRTGGRSNGFAWKLLPGNAEEMIALFDRYDNLKRCG